MWWLPVYLDISMTRRGRLAYLNRLASVLRPGAKDPLGEAQRDFDNYGRSLLNNVRKSIYSDLSIIDNKTNSLMQLNAILVVVYSIAYGNILEGKFHPTHQQVSELIICIFLSLLGILLLMTCVFIRWETYKATAENIEKDLLWWINLRDHRTLRYRLAWFANIASIFLFIALLIRNFQTIISVGTP